jgi:two-component system chemotaxis response regulator CheY
MDGYGKRVLVVEDDDAGRNLLSVLLVHAGYNVHAASDGQEALREMKRRRFDVVITDYRMPRLDGMEFLSLSRIEWPDTPVVMVSGENPDMLEAAVRQGAYAWLHKPYEPAILIETVRDAARASQERHSHNVSSPAAGSEVPVRADMYDGSSVTDNTARTAQGTALGVRVVAPTMIVGLAPGCVSVRVEPLTQHTLHETETSQSRYSPLRPSGPQ